MADNSPANLNNKLQTLSKYWVRILSATLTAVAIAILQAKGEQIFDSLVAVLGKRLFLQTTTVILCSLGYCAYLLVRRERKLHHRRQLYWAPNDPLPFCPHCYDDSKKRVHLFVSHNKDYNLEDYECHICNHDFLARNGNDFHPQYSNFRALMKSNK